MDFSLSEEQVLLRDSVDKYVREHASTERHRALLATEPGFDPASWQQFAQLGWLAVPFSADLGGIDGGPIDLMVMTEALGKGLVREPFLSTVATCGNFLQYAGSEAQQAQYIPTIIDGSAQWAFAFAEDNSSYDLADISTIATTAQPDSGHYVLHGAKHAVLNGHCADYLIVSALTAAAGSSGVSLFIVEASTAGLARENFVAVDGSRGAHVSLDGVQVPAGQLLGELHCGIATMEAVIDRAIIAIGGEALGAMQALLQATVEYTKTREQFGQPISKFQALQHRMADMYLKVEETRSLLLNAAIALEEGSAEAPAACAALKVKVAEAGRFVAQESVQLHGGIGMTDELSVGHHYKRLLLLARLYGDEGYYLQKFADLSARSAA